MRVIYFSDEKSTIQFSFRMIDFWSSVSLSFATDIAKACGQMKFYHTLEKFVFLLEKNFLSLNVMFKFLCLSQNSKN